MPVLFVSALADSAFWNRHCFEARGVESHDGRRLIRLDFSPALDIRDPDWEGSAWLDSARSVLARVDFRLTNLRHVDGPQRFEGYTVFSTPTVHRDARFDGGVVDDPLADGGCVRADATLGVDADVGDSGADVPAAYAALVVAGR